MCCVSYSISSLPPCFSWSTTDCFNENPSYCSPYLNITYLILEQISNTNTNIKGVHYSPQNVTYAFFPLTRWKRSVIIYKKASQIDFCTSKDCKSSKCEHECKCKCVSPEAWAEPEEEEEAVTLSEAGQEGEHQVDAQDVDQTLPPSHLIAQTPPNQCSHQHGHIYQ